MKELILTTEIIFLEAARERLNFPVVNSIRMSFWIPNDEFSTFSEIQFQNNRVDIGITEIAKIKLVERDFLVNRIKNGSEFRIGVFPNEIAIGKVIDLHSFPTRRSSDLFST